MSAKSHLEELQRKHQVLDTEIASKQKSPSVSTLQALKNVNCASRNKSNEHERWFPSDTDIRVFWSARRITGRFFI